MTETVTMRRDYPAPPDRVFRAWTEVDLLRTWFGCGPGMLWTVHAWDATPGGAIHVSLTFDTGPFEVKGEFLAVEPPSHLRYTFGDDQIVDVRFTTNGTGTRLELVHTGVLTEHLGFVDAGWTAAMDQLGEAV